MATNYTLLTRKLEKLKTVYESAIRVRNWANVIRSSVIIKELHEYIVTELRNRKINNKFIFTDKKIMGYFKTKTQDVLVAKKIAEPLISINVRSQLSSVQKNYDTLFERLIAESTNLHEKHPSLVCGYLYLLPTFGYSYSAAQQGRIVRNERFNWEKYLYSFSLLSDRKNEKDSSYKYEEICLLAVDFSCAEPKILLSTNDFEREKLISSQFAKSFNYKPLSTDNFIDRLLQKFKERSKEDLMH